MHGLKGALTRMTFTLIARNPFTRQLGLAMASGSDDCIGGSVVGETLNALGRPAVIVVQGKGDRALRQKLAASYLQGQSTVSLMSDLAQNDSALPLRQVLMASFDSPLIVETGKFCGPWAGHHAEEHLIVAGNVLSSASVITRMRKAYMNDLNAPMRHRLMAALLAGVSAGGDIRGHASAGIIIAGEHPLDVRITASRQPFEDLQASVA